MRTQRVNLLLCVGLMVMSMSKDLSTTFRSAKPPESPRGVPLTWIDNAMSRKAVCNDGSPSGYYFAPGSGVGATAWVIHLQGGGFCFDFDSCQRREQRPTQETAMSSNDWPPETTGSGNGLMSADPSENPDFYQANRVYIRYCSSDLFSGATDPYAGNPWYFRGRTILRAVLEDLSDPALTPAPNLSAATEVVFSGGSAGGIAIFPNLDWLANYVSMTLGPAEVYGLSDAGWLVDIPPFNPDQLSFAEQLQPAYNFWLAANNIDDGCAAANAGQEWRCYIGQYAYPFITTPLAVYNSQYDADGLIKLGLTYPYDSAEMAYRQVYQAALVASFQQNAITPVFSPISEEHAIAVHPPFTGLAVVGRTLKSVLGDWIFDRPGLQTVIEYRSYLPWVSRFSQQSLISP